MRHTEVRASIIAADQSDARRLAEAEDDYKAAVCDAVVAFDETCRVRPH
jgi:hypothetical protein